VRDQDSVALYWFGWIDSIDLRAMLGQRLLIPGTLISTFLALLTFIGLDVAAKPN